MIIAAARTAVGSFGGTLAKVPAPALGAAVIKDVLARAKTDASRVDEVIMGNVLTAGLGQNPARQAAMGAGLPHEVPAMTVDMVCGSRLRAVHLAAQAIKCGDAQIVVAGGQENMSATPHVLNGSRDGTRMGDAKLKDVMVHDGLWCAFNDYHMGITAENIADKYGISREEQDAFAATSQQRAQEAIAKGWFEEEICALTIPQKRGKDPLVFAADEYPKAGTTADGLGKCRPPLRLASPPPRALPRPPIALPRPPLRLPSPRARVASDPLRVASLPCDAWKV